MNLNRPYVTPFFEPQSPKPRYVKKCSPWRQRSCGHKRTLGMIAVVIMFLPLHSGAMKPDDVTEAEMALIPPYCRDANTFGYCGTADCMSPNAPMWVAKMGKGFWAIHHYCWAQISLQRIQRPTTPPNVRTAKREEALADLYYVITNSQADFVLLPEIYTKIGEIQLDLKRITHAEAAFAKARELKPNYWPPYFHWAEYLRRTGQKNRAREVVMEGLSNAPGSKTLESLLRDLDGNPAGTKPRPSSSISVSPVN